MERKYKLGDSVYVLLPPTFNLNPAMESKC